MKLDLLAFAAHPDDTELSCAGTLASHVSMGMNVGVIDFTRGEMGTRGTAEIRDQEAKKSAEILGLAIRENLGFEDAFFEDDRHHQLEIIKKIRKYRPDIILAN
ncbi:MAG: PIG-L family deacetylase, partial [Bacteroidota bacterium]